MIKNTCDAQNTTAKRRPCLYSILTKEKVNISRIKSPQDCNIMSDKVIDSDRCQRKEPQRQGRRKQKADFAGSKPLYAE